MIPADFELRIERPAELPGRFVSGVWYARGRTPHQRARILASVDAVLLLILGDPLRMTVPRGGAVAQELTGAWITGPHERPILNEPAGETHVVGAVFAPGGVGRHEALAASLVSPSRCAGLRSAWWCAACCRFDGSPGRTRALTR
jgi:hypothetical protein